MARALLRRAGVLVMDEATANVGKQVSLEMERMDERKSSGGGGEEDVGRD